MSLFIKGINSNAKFKKNSIESYLFTKRLDEFKVKKFKDKIVLIKISEIEMYFKINAQGLLVLTEKEVIPDTSIFMTVNSFFNQIISNKNKDISIQGDIDLAKEVSEILKKIRWDVEEDLSKIVGDVAANRLGKIGKNFLSGSKSAAINIAEAFKEYWEEENPLIAKKFRVERLLNDIDLISEDVDRLEAKINNLAVKISK